MATNRIDILDSALLRPGRIDRKIEFPPPNEEVRQRFCFCTKLSYLFSYKIGVSSSKTPQKNLDPSYKMNLDFWVQHVVWRGKTAFWRGKTSFSRIYMSDLHIYGQIGLEFGRE